MHIFDIIGPVMAGPSSSHTAGVVRIGNVVRNILGAEPAAAVVQFHGSFAATYKGHGSDKAITAGLMGFAPHDARIRDSLAIADEKGIRIKFETIDLPHAHPNTVAVNATAHDGHTASVLGESVGGGNILIKKIGDTAVEYCGKYDTLIVSHEDTPGAVALVANTLAEARINIARMKVYRARKGGDAIMIIETDGKISKKFEFIFQNKPNIHHATVIGALEG